MTLDWQNRWSALGCLFGSVYEDGGERGLGPGLLSSRSQRELAPKQHAIRRGKLALKQQDYRGS
jgi:hypothetical protein